jgi:hypothetical protein
MKKAALFPYTFVLMNWAAVVGLYHFVRHEEGAHKTIWARHSPHAKLT